MKSTGSTCGTTWRRTMRPRVAPIACAASMNGSERMRRASARSRRAYHGTETRAMPIAAVLSPTPRPTVTAIARIRGGKARIASIVRIAMPSAAPPRVPATRPIRPPMRAPPMVTSEATVSEIRAPSATRASTSRPSWSVPIGWAPVGACSELIRSCLSGPWPQRIGTRTAKRTNAAKTATGKASWRSWRSAPQARPARPATRGLGPSGSAGVIPSSPITSEPELMLPSSISIPVCGSHNSRPAWALVVLETFPRASTAEPADPFAYRSVGPYADCISNADQRLVDQLGQLPQPQPLAALGRLDRVLVHRHVLGAGDDEDVDALQLERLADPVLGGAFVAGLVGDPDPAAAGAAAE